MSPQWVLSGSTWYLYRVDPYLSKSSKEIFQYVRWSESGEEYVDMHGTSLGKDLNEAKTKIEKQQFSRRDWAIRSVVDGKETDRIIECGTESEARDWVERFPQSYQLLSRESAGEWNKVS